MVESLIIRNKAIGAERYTIREEDIVSDFSIFGDNDFPAAIDIPYCKRLKEKQRLNPCLNAFTP